MVRLNIQMGVKMSEMSEEEYIVISRSDFDKIRNGLNTIVETSQHGIPQYAFNEACHHLDGYLEKCGDVASKTDSMMEEMFENTVKIDIDLES